MAYNNITKLYEGYIYCVTNKLNNMQYIGQTSTTIKRRWEQHLSEVKHGRLYFYNALRFFGVENFIVSELYCIFAKTKDELFKNLNLLEIDTIDKYNTLSPHGYNLTIGGNNCINPARKICQYNKYGKLIKNYDSLSEASDQLNINLSSIFASCSGRAKTAHGWIFRYENEPFDKYSITNCICKPVNMYTKTGEFIRRYDSMTEAAIDIGKNALLTNVISSVCYGKSSTLKGYVFRFIEDSFDKYEIKGCFKKRVNQYSLTGDFINSFTSIKEAGKTLNIDNSWITACCKNKAKTAGGYRWKYYTDNADFLNNIGRKCKKICQYNKSGDLIKTHNSIIDAANDVKRPKNNIYNVCVGVNKTSGGYVFRYYGDDFNKFNLNGHPTKPVIQYDMQGNFIKRYNSIKEASEEINISSSGINNCCKRRIKSTNGFRFTYDNEKLSEEYRNKLMRPILQYTIDNKFISNYQSITAACNNTGVSVANIFRVCAGKGKTAGGYIWRYATAEEIQLHKEGENN